MAIARVAALRTFVPYSTLEDKIQDALVAWLERGESCPSQHTLRFMRHQLQRKAERWKDVWRDQDGLHTPLPLEHEPATNGLYERLELVLVWERLDPLIKRLLIGLLEEGSMKARFDDEREYKKALMRLRRWRQSIGEEVAL